MKKFGYRNVIHVLITNMYVKFIVLPVILLLIWLVLAITVIINNSFTVVQFPHNENADNRFLNKKLTSGKKLIGEFTANEDNLGIISVKFGDLPTVDYDTEDIFIFRIKEKYSDTWAYENQYRSGLAPANDYLPLGFAPVARSKGKKYIFEIISLKGGSANALVTGDRNPIYLTKYQFSKSFIFHSIPSFMYFIKLKIYTLIINPDLLQASAVYILPLVFYIVWLVLESKFYKNLIHTMDKQNKFNKHTNNIFSGHLSDIYAYTSSQKINHTGGMLYILLLLLFIYVYTVIFSTTVNVILFGILGLWVIAILANSYTSKLTYLIAAGVIAVSIIRLEINPKSSIDNASALSYFLLLIGIVQDLSMIFRKNKTY